MNCQEFWNTMPELGDADRRHLDDCAACAARMARERELAEGLRAMAASDQRIAAPARVEARLTAAFRAQNGLPARSRGRFGWAPALQWAAAAAAVIAIGLFMVRVRQPEAKPPAAARGVEMAMTWSAAGSQADDDGFIPLPNAAKLADTEDVNVVRVEMPRSAMMAVGIEVSPERAEELVQADVMLGPDGLARAVRFLDTESLL